MRRKNMMDDTRVMAKGDHINRYGALYTLRTSSLIYNSVKWDWPLEAHTDTQSLRMSQNSFALNYGPGLRMADNDEPNMQELYRSCKRGAGYRSPLAILKGPNGNRQVTCARYPSGRSRELLHDRPPDFSGRHRAASLYNGKFTSTY